MERWRFVAPRKKQQMNLPVLAWDEFGRDPKAFCTGHLSFEAFKFLCNSIEAIKIESNKGTGLPSSQRRLQPLRDRACLEMLPAELLGSIFAILSPEEFMALGLCSQTLWTHAITWAKSGYLWWRNKYSWVDTPIICVGDELQILPEDLYNNLPGLVPDTISQPDQPGPDATLTARRAKILDEFMISCERTPFSYDYLYQEVFSRQIKSAGIPESLHVPMKACLPSFSIETRSKWYLRSLTHQEYIRMEAIVTSDGEATVALPGRRWLTLDILLMWLISWRGDGEQDTWSWEDLKEFEGFTDHNLSDTWHDPTYGPMDHHFWPIWAGPWAGHNLDVVTERELDAGWTDRTDYVEAQAPKLLRLFLGYAMAEDHVNQQYWEEAFRQDGDYWELEVMEYSSSWDGDESDGELITKRMPQSPHEIS
ncbi:hypothetical protein FBEOM_5809 [Fusarium beomiforme]|uniref:F-box domain-containing protein n=1 Tax=Fusarium beomiforme TaxID=44412 RepID=A0A9P5AKU3_9HYPO|nr:hypothetical protein FBEOM_5809 [Fusarium beomiforme]